MREVELEPASFRSLSKLTHIAENKLVRTRRFGSEGHEAEGAVELVCIGAVGPQPQAGKVTVCQTHDRTYELSSNPLPPTIQSDIEMANSANHRIAEVRVTV